MPGSASPSKPFTRRDFLLGAGAALGGALLAACANLTTQPAIAVNATPTPGEESPSIKRKWRISGPPSDSLWTFDRAMKNFMQLHNIPAGALAVTGAGKLLLAHGYTWDAETVPETGPDALFRIASLSKPLTAAAVLRLAQDGRLELGDRLVDWLAIEPAAQTRLEELTLLQLLQHLGGWDRQATFDPLFYDVQIARRLGVSLPVAIADILAFMSDQPLQQQPGSSFRYSHFGYLLLGKVIEAAAGASYAQAMDSLVFAPLSASGLLLGQSQLEQRAENEVLYSSLFQAPSVLEPNRPMTAAPYGSFRMENLEAAAGWLGSSVALARYLASFSNPEGSVLLEPGSIETMFAPPSIGAMPGGQYYGCGWFVRDAPQSPVAWHGGSLAGTTALMVERWDGLGWVALFNQSDDERDPAGSTYMDIGWMLQDAARAVEDWPAEDQFGLFPAV